MGYPASGFRVPVQNSWMDGAMDKTLYNKGQVEFRKLLRELREAAGLRQQDVAELIDEPQSFVSKYESGERRLDLLEVREVCRALRVPMGTLVTRLEKRLTK
jgi:ribosome-binding protein aMBF1 (putative translation factor)